MRDWVSEVRDLRGGVKNGFSLKGTFPRCAGVGLGVFMCWVFMCWDGVGRSPARFELGMQF